MGLTQHVRGFQNITMFVNLLLRGNIGREAAGISPVRGHSNVQGDRTMGIWERVHSDFLDALQKEFNFSPPRKDGFDVVESLKMMNAGKTKVYFSLAATCSPPAPTPSSSPKACASRT